MIRIVQVAAVFLFAGLCAPATAQDAVDPAVSACKSTGLLALREKAPEITDLILDNDTLAISSADTMVGDVPVKRVIMGDAYIARKEKTGAPDRFVCLIGDKGKVLLTFFTAQ